MAESHVPLMVLFKRSHIYTICQEGEGGGGGGVGWGWGVVMIMGDIRLVFFSWFPNHSHTFTICREGGGGGGGGGGDDEGHTSDGSLSAPLYNRICWTG